MVTVFPYLPNKYTNWYYQIIDRAVSRSTDIGYFERHHVVPSCFFVNNRRRSTRKNGWIDGNPDSDLNLVLLTPREHFLCHWLLTKMVIGVAKRLVLNAFAAFRMASSGQYRIWASWQYELLKRSAVDATKGTKWWNNGTESIRSFDSPGIGWNAGHNRSINSGKKWYHKEDGQRCISKVHPGDGWEIGYGKLIKKCWHNGTDRLISEDCPGVDWKPGNGCRNNVGLKWWHRGSDRTLSKDCPGIGWKHGNGIRPASGKKWYHTTDGIRKQFENDPGHGWIPGKGKTKR